jgi:hypothetical protein
MSGGQESRGGIGVFEPGTYGAAFGELLAEPRLAELGPGRPEARVRAQLEALSLDSAFEKRAVRDADMARCCLAGIWLHFDFLDQSHALSQKIDTTTGSYWHGILHRREPDYSNAKYWFRKVRSHPVFEPLAKAAAELAQQEKHPSASVLRQGSWDAFAFVDLCEAAAGGRVPCAELCRRIQQAEWQLLFDYCYRQAMGEAG